MFKFLNRRKLRKEFKAAVSDGRLTTSEEKYLSAVASELGVGQKYLDQTRETHFKNETSPIVSEIKSTRRMSPDQEATLIEIAGRLGIELEFDHSLQMCRELWAWENGDQVYLPEVETSILLKKGEVCCLCAPATWKQMEVVKTRVATRGFSTSFRIMKGVSYRVSNLKPVYSESEGLATIAEGEFCLTNKRISFSGGSRSTAINHGRIIDVDLYEDGIEISKASGKHDFFVMHPITAEYTCMALNMLNGAA